MRSLLVIFSNFNKSSFNKILNSLLLNDILYICIIPEYILNDTEDGNEIKEILKLILHIYSIFTTNSLTKINIVTLLPHLKYENYHYDIHMKNVYIIGDSHLYKKLELSIIDYIKRILPFSSFSVSNIHYLSPCDTKMIKDISLNLPPKNSHIISRASKGQTLTPLYEAVALGGTFDRLHNGHKYLLTHASLIAKSVLICGVSDGPLLKGKELEELIQPIQQRIQIVKEFVQKIDPTLKLEIAPIYNIYGPTIFVPEIGCCVLTKETIKGGQQINEERIRRGLKPLHLEVIDYIEDYKGTSKTSIVHGANDFKVEDTQPLPNPKDNNFSQSKSDEGEVTLKNKLSSSHLRKQSLGAFIPHDLMENDDVACFERLSLCQYPPYVIGLTGGICSGKSTFASLLLKQQDHPTQLKVLDCDKLVHGIYDDAEDPQNGIIQNIVSSFGSGVLTRDRKIDRKKLGAIVFGDEGKRTILNGIVWPAVAKLVKGEIEAARKDGTQLVLIEASLLLEAGWCGYVHELWVSFVPRDMAIQRLMERDGISKDEAVVRVNSQPTNQTRIRYADVVLTTQFGPEFSKKLAHKALHLLWRRITEIEKKT